MNSTLTPIDISKQPDILRLAEEVQVSRTPRILQRNRKNIAVVMPLATALPAQPENTWKHYDSKRVQKALKQSAGALEGINKEALLSDIAEQRIQEVPNYE